MARMAAPPTAKMARTEGGRSAWGTATTTTPGNGSTASGWLKGMAVPFMRKGRIWVATDASGSQVQTGPINVWHSSDGTHAQGVFTFLATSFTVGNEIDVAPGCVVFNPNLAYSAQYTDPWGNVFSMYPVEISI